MKKMGLDWEEVKMSIANENIEWEEVVKQAKEGNKEAFAKLYEGVYKDLYCFALYTLKNQQDAEDVVSEAVIKAYSGIRKLREVEAFRSWMFAITSNLCKKKMREYYKRTEPLIDNLMIQMPAIEEREDIKKAMDTLDNQERLLIYLSVFGGYKGKEIANMLHMNPNTVRSKKTRAYEKLSRIL